jgi:two-component system response regulator LytT
MQSTTKVLLAEDDPLLADLILSDLGTLFPYGQLEALGPAESFSTAVDLLHRKMPDIALLDIELGEDRTAGIRIAQHINLTRPIPVVFLSGLPRQEGFDIAKLTAPYSYIPKPYHRQQLADILELLLIRDSQSKLALADRIKASTVLTPIRSIFVTTAHGELTALPLDKLVLLEADGKIIRAYLSDQEKPVVFTSPGLKNFFQQHQEELQKGFFQLSRKHIVCLSKVRQVKDNHVILPRYTSGSVEMSFSLPIPINGDAKQLLLTRLGRRI